MTTVPALFKVHVAVVSGTLQDNAAVPLPEFVHWLWQVCVGTQVTHISGDLNAQCQELFARLQDCYSSLNVAKRGDWILDIVYVPSRPVGAEWYPGAGVVVKITDQFVEGNPVWEHVFQSADKSVTVRFLVTLYLESY